MDTRNSGPNVMFLKILRCLFSSRLVVILFEWPPGRAKVSKRAYRSQYTTNWPDGRNTHTDATSCSSTRSLPGSGRDRSHHSSGSSCSPIFASRTRSLLSRKTSHCSPVALRDLLTLLRTALDISGPITLSEPLGYSHWYLSLFSLRNLGSVLTLLLCKNR